MTSPSEPKPEPSEGQESKSEGSQKIVQPLKISPEFRELLEIFLKQNSAFEAQHDDFFSQLLVLTAEEEAIMSGSTSTSSNSLSIEPVSSVSEPNKNNVQKAHTTEDSKKLSLGFIQVFSTLVFISGIALGVYGSLKPEIVEYWEDGKPIRVERRVGRGDFVTMGAGYGMAGLAAGTVFFSYAPGFVLGTVDVIGSALAGIAGTIGSKRIKQQESDDNKSEADRTI